MHSRQAIQVVLVDDSALVRERIAAHLASLEGVAIAGQAADVASGSALVQALQPDVLLLDIDLPMQSGLALLKMVKSQAGSPITIMLTNYDHPLLRQRCAELGADYFFHKSTQFEKTIEVCQELAAQRRSTVAAMNVPELNPQL